MDTTPVAHSHTLPITVIKRAMQEDSEGLHDGGEDDGRHVQTGIAEVEAADKDGETSSHRRGQASTRRTWSAAEDERLREVRAARAPTG